MLSVKDFVAVFELLSVTTTVKLALPVPLGVPEILPEEGSNERPAGREPAVMDQV
jgi:hypothetical protein